MILRFPKHVIFLGHEGASSRDELNNSPRTLKRSELFSSWYFISRAFFRTVLEICTRCTLSFQRAHVVRNHLRIKMAPHRTPKHRPALCTSRDETPHPSNCTGEPYSVEFRECVQRFSITQKLKRSGQSTPFSPIQPIGDGWFGFRL